jgi:arylsulfatase A-like enzyme
MSNTDKPNIILFFVDNLGFGELGCYGGGILRGADTAHIDRFAHVSTRLTNFAPEAQCTPSRSALLTGRYAARSGTQSVPVPGLGEGGLVAWERTIAEVLSDAGYATQILGKWHLGHSAGRWPTDHGFDEWYGIPRSYDECLWSEDPWYDPQRDPVSYVMEGRKGEGVREIGQLTVEVRRDIDIEYERRAHDFMARNAKAGRPFFLYYCHSLLHLPTLPRAEFKGATGHGDFADCLLELDHDFGRLLDHLDGLDIAENTIVVFFGDNGAEESLPWRGTSGFFEGSYFTGMEGSLRTPCIIRWPGRVPAGRVSNEIVHITDMFTTMIGWAGSEIPVDRVIDGVDQGYFLLGEQENSNREGFPFWNGERLYGVKWRNWKGIMIGQRYMWDPIETFPMPQLFNLIADPKERENVAIHHTWVFYHLGRILLDYFASTGKEPPVPAGAPLDFVPQAAA